jgi:predicted nucleic acid-binding protein
VKLVLDTSFAILWLAGERGSGAVAEFDARHHAGVLQVHAPELFVAEMANAVWKSVETGRRTLEEGVQMFENLKDTAIELHRHRDLTTAALDIALRRGLTVYESLYVALALREVLPLFTADRKLAAAVEDLVEVITA